MADLATLLRSGEAAPEYVPIPVNTLSGRERQRLMALQRTPEMTRDPLGYTRGTVAAMADPLGLPSAAVGMVSPETRDAWRAQYETRPEAAMAGSALTPWGTITNAGVKGAELAGQGLSALLRSRAGQVVAPVAATTAAATEVGSQGASEEVKKLQVKLRDAGYYKGRIDGQMGEETNRANEAFQANQRASERQRLESDRVQTQRTEAEARAAETRRLTEEAQIRDRQRTEGDERLRTMENDVSPWSRALRDYGPPIGYGAGIGLGLMLRRGIAGAGNRRLAGETASTNERMAAPAADLPERVGRVNRFWDEGGAAQMPFTPAPGKRHAIASNPDAPSAATLYQPPEGMSRYMRTPDVIAAGGLSAESGIAQYMGSGAREEVARAREAAKNDPSEINIRSLQAAIDRSAIYDTATNLGRGGLATYLLAAGKGPYKYARPNVDVAEAERMRIDQMLGPQRRAKPAGGGAPPSSASPTIPPTPTVAPSGTLHSVSGAGLGGSAVIDHHSAYQPRNAQGRFSGAPERPE